MQSLFAYAQCKEADYQLGLEELDTRFQPDLTSMEVQDRESLSNLRKESKAQFNLRFKNSKTPDHAHPDVNSSVEKALKNYEGRVRKDLLFFKQNLVIEVERINELYYSVLGLLTAFSDCARADAKVNHKNLIENPLIKALASHDDLNRSLSRTTFGWSEKMNQVRGWFKDTIKADQDYINFISLESPTQEDNKTIINHIVRKLILGSDSISDFYQEHDIRWAEDKEIIKGLVNRTLKSFDGTTMTLQKLTLDWEDDRDFMEKLFSGTVNLNHEHHALIAKNTKNWEVERLPLTDRIILEMAIAEMTLFPSIPVKVTINEYIELAKQYSTPKSRQFINGILDVIARELKASGEMKKSGRGLIDNK
ncbi:MAG: transcription antitermination factor NusB [Flammeovirgaceae bacterium]|nr:transcription antitermination factor NusB [Flammeovirgaceae bacterium]